MDRSLFGIPFQRIIHTHRNSFQYTSMHPARLKNIHDILSDKPLGKGFKLLFGYTAAGIEPFSGKNPRHSEVFYSPQSILIVHFEITAHLKKQQPLESRSKETVLGVKIG